MYEIGYQDTDKEVEVKIFGLQFKIKGILNEENIKEIEENKNNVELIDKQIKMLIGEDAIDKINKKRKEDGREEMDLIVKANVLGMLMGVYAEQIGTQAIDNISGTYNKLDSKINSFSRRNISRYNKRYYRKNRSY